MNERRFGIINTRPKQQADKLTFALKRLSNSITELPMVSIQDVKDTSNITTTMSLLIKYDYIIFVSQNAALSLHPYWPSTKSKSNQIIAVGPGTAAAINQFSKTDIIPGIHSKEGILALPQLQQLRNKKILICAGNNHKPQMRQQLIKRGAEVELLVCYHVSKLAINPQKIIDQLPDVQQQIIICTSMQILELTLDSFLSLPTKTWLQQQIILVITNKQSQYARDRGFCGEILLSNGAQNAAILDAIETWHLNK